jgi:glutathione S-transferase
MMIGNGAGFFPPPYIGLPNNYNQGPPPIQQGVPPPPFIGLPNNYNQGPPPIQQGVPPPSYYGSAFQAYQQPNNAQNCVNNSNCSVFKLYDLETNNQNEIIRLLFSFAGISFKDKRLKQDEEEYDKIKDQLPILRINNQFKIFHLHAIARYLAREFRLYGNDSHDQAIVDTIIETTRCFQEKIFEQIQNSTNLEERKIILTQFIKDHAEKYLNQLEKCYKIFNRHGPFYLGSHISLADLIVYDTIKSLIDIDSKLLDNYSHLKEARRRLEKYPQLANYLNKTKNNKIKKKRHATVSPTSNHQRHHQHRHRSHDEHQSTHRSRRLTPILQTRQESITPVIPTTEKKSTPPQTSEEKPASPVVAEQHSEVADN